MRLIDADALKTTASIQRADFNTIETIRQWIDEAPTIDAGPARHGKWERNSARIAGWAKCSECGNMEPLLCTTHFCGHCGAEMEDFDETD